MATPAVLPVPGTSAFDYRALGEAVEERRQELGLTESGLLRSVDWLSKGPLAISPESSETFAWDEQQCGNSPWGRLIAETLVLDESPLGHAVRAGNTEVDVFEAALAVISHGSFPSRGARVQLSKGQQRQLRDAMIHEAHVREHRHVLVTEDTKGLSRAVAETRAGAARSSAPARGPPIPRGKVVKPTEGPCTPGGR